MAGDSVRLFLLVFLVSLTVFGMAAHAQPLPPRSPAPPGMPALPAPGTAPYNPAAINPPPAAQMVPGTGCDANYWNVLWWRGWMEGKHDMEAAQTIMGKPVSVLEVSCFNEHLIELGDAANRMFSDNTERSTGVVSGTAVSNALFDCTECGDGITVPVQEQSQCVIQLDSYEPSVGSPCGPDPPGGPFDDQNMERALQRAIRTGGVVYLNNNFPRPVMRGCPPIPPRWVSTAPPPAFGVCSTMYGIWNAARMHDFDTNTFNTFYEMVWSEPRAGAAFAYNCQFGAAPGTYFPRLRWDIAYNGRRSPVPPLPPATISPYIPGAFPPTSLYNTVTEATLGGMDTALPYLESIRSPTTPPPVTTPPTAMPADRCTTQNPIPTGMTFRARDTNGAWLGPYNDAICAAPGCRYDPLANPPRCVRN